MENTVVQSAETMRQNDSPPQRNEEDSSHRSNNTGGKKSRISARIRNIQKGVHQRCTYDAPLGNADEIHSSPLRDFNELSGKESSDNPGGNHPDRRDKMRFLCFNWYELPPDVPLTKLRDCKTYPAVPKSQLRTNAKGKPDLITNTSQLTSTYESCYTKG